MGLRYPAGAEKEARRHRKRARELGLRPPSAEERGRLVAFHPAWKWRQDPAPLGELLEAARDAGARVVRLDLALDFLGLPAAETRGALFPSLEDRELEPGTWDALALRMPEGGASRWMGRGGHAARYLMPARCPRNLVAYADRPSKLEPEGPAVFHLEARAVGEAVPLELRNPAALLGLRDPAVAWYMAGDLWRPTKATPALLETMTDCASRVGAVVGLYRPDGRGWCDFSAEQIAHAAGCSQRTVFRVLRRSCEAIGGSPRGGRGRTRKRRPIPRGTLLASRDGPPRGAPSAYPTPALQRSAGGGR